MTLINLSGIQTGNWTGDDLVTLADARENSALLDGTKGLVLTTEDTAHDLKDLTEKAAFIEIRFPAFGDGRGFSLAVRLRKDLGYTAEIRATGPVIPDQALFLLRSGFDSVEVQPERAEAFRVALQRYGSFYQTDYLGHTSVARRRHNVKDKPRKAS